MPSIERIITIAAIAAAAAVPAIAGREKRSKVNRQAGARRSRSGRPRFVRAIKARWLRGVCALASTAVHHVRRLILGGALGLALLSCLLSAAPAMGNAQTRSLELNAIEPQFTSFTCLNGSCSLALLTDAGKATSNLGTGAGSTEATLIIDLSPGGSCNIVDESRKFSFAEGTVLVHSHHEDCATHGLRVDTTFDVTGGTGALEGASGSGRELSAAIQPGFEYIGTISF